MKNYKSMRGVNIDIGKLLAQQDKNITVGNTASNARGDKLGRAGRVMKSADEIAREHYNRNNPNAVKSASIKLDDTPAPKTPDKPMEDDWQEPEQPAQKETKVEPVFEDVSPGPIPEEYNDDEWVEDDDGNFVKADETKKNKSKKSK
ncbi:hypothetical protein N9I00_01150 [bacterium]|nr:hypothetical protein [bacterium]